MTLIRMLAFRPPASAEKLPPPGPPAPRARPTSATATPASTAAPISAPAAAPDAHTEADAAPVLAAQAATGEAVQWAGIVASLELAGAARSLASNCVLLGRAPGVVRLSLDPRSVSLRTRALEDKLAQALSRHFGEALHLEIEVREAAVETPARAAARAQAQRLAQARASFEADAVVSEFKERLGATVLPDSVRPVKPSP